jgi:hypothetical protein
MWVHRSSLTPVVALRLGSCFRSDSSDLHPRLMHVVALRLSNRALPEPFLKLDRTPGVNGIGESDVAFWPKVQKMTDEIC